VDVVGPEPCPLPESPALAAVATALVESGSWGIVLDGEWRVVHITDDLRLSHGRLLELVPVPLGAHYFSEAALEVMLGWSGGVVGLEAYRCALRALAPWVLADAPDAREQVSPRLADLLEGVDPSRAPAAVSYDMPGARSAGTQAWVMFTAVRLHDADGAHIGIALTGKPAVSMSVLGTFATADQRHFERAQRLVKASRQPAAILFADLEASSGLSRRLSTASYFGLGRRLVRTADRCVVDAGGLVGRHAGDGVVSFFLAEHAGSESAAARACILAMRTLRDATADVAARSGLEAADVVLRFGLHWGSMLYVGQISTAARVEVNALGDEVNETARIEACATGARSLASKALMERLRPEDAAALGIDPDRLHYSALADLPSATEKARRDAPAIAVCEI
jgi:class 3 adenylate cyclase